MRMGWSFQGNAWGRWTDMGMMDRTVQTRNMLGRNSDYLLPVVATPLMRNFWPNRKARKIGSSETRDIANSEPHEVFAVASTKDFRATGTVYMSGSVR